MATLAGSAVSLNATALLMYFDSGEFMRLFVWNRVQKNASPELHLYLIMDCYNDQLTLRITTTKTVMDFPSFLLLLFLVVLFSFSFLSDSIYHCSRFPRCFENTGPRSIHIDFVSESFGD